MRGMQTLFGILLLALPAVTTGAAEPASPGASADRVASSRSPRAVTTAIQPDSIDLAMDLSNRSIEELRTLEGAIEARHCRKLADSFLRQRFWDYQHEHCGFRTSWEIEGQARQTPPPPPETPVSAAEQDFVTRVRGLEQRIRAGQVRPDSSYDVRAAVNVSQFSTLPDTALRQLFRDGFVVLPASHQQLSQVYEENDYRMIPNFVTVDAALHLYHLYFDFTLRQIEEGPLLQAADSLTVGMREGLLARYRAGPPGGSASPELRDGLRRDILYFAVAEALLAGDSTGTTPPWLDRTWAADFRREIELVWSHAGKARGPIAGEMDYTLFIPRGHYTRSATLTRYFRALAWLGIANFPLAAPDGRSGVPIEAPLAIVWELQNSPRLLALYDRIYGPTEFYVGPTDDITPMLVRSVADSLCGRGALLERWIADKEAIRVALTAQDPARIRAPGAPPEIRFMGVRYIPDSRILQMLTHWPSRALPTGLDIFAVMDVPSATSILRSSPIEWEDYWPTVSRLQHEFGDFAPRPDDNLYRRWIHLLRMLNQKAPTGAPLFMQREPWARKNLSTGLASWAQLRHDTILYAKQSSAECGGGDEIPHYPSFVEARPDVFEELLALHRFTVEELSRRGLVTERLREIGNQVGDVVDFLARVSRKEVAGTPVTQEEYDSLRIFGSTLGYLTTALLLGDFGQWAEVQGPDRSMATVADVHTTRGAALEEGVGYADEIYALVEIGGDLYVTRGSVFSYYEFTQPAAQRLTDEKWQQKLATDPPPRPSWLQGFLNQHRTDLPTPYHYSSGC